MPCGLEPEPVGEQHAAAGDLRDREVDEHDAAREHLHAERHVRRGDEQPGDERRQQDRKLERPRVHCAPFSSRAIVSSKRPNRSFAASSPPTVNGSTTALIFARSAIHCDARSLWYAARITIFAGWRCSVASTSVRCAVVGSTPGLGSSAATSFDAEPRDQIGERLVLDDDRHALERRRLLLPVARSPRSSDRRTPCSAPGSTRRWRDRARPAARRAAPATRAMLRGSVWMCGLPPRVDVAFGAVEARRLFEQRHVARRLEVARLARLDLRIAGLLRHERQPADLELGAGRDDEVGAARARDEARLRLDVMRVLQRVGRGVDVDLVAAQLLRERAPFGHRGEHVERGERRRRDDSERDRGDQLQMRISCEASSELVRAVRAERQDVLHEELVVGDARAAPCFAATARGSG